MATGKPNGGLSVGRRPLRKIKTKLISCPHLTRKKDGLKLVSEAKMPGNHEISQLISGSCPNYAVSALILIWLCDLVTTGCIGPALLAISIGYDFLQRQKF
jgi:hypothetical protein